MPPVPRHEPYPASNFRVEIDGIPLKGSFSEVSGIQAEADPIEYREGTDPDSVVHRLPGLRKFSNIVLKRGIIGDLTLWNWMQNTLQGTVQRASMAIMLLDENQNEVMRWNFIRAWPCKWTGPALNAKSNEVAIETLEICHEGLEIET